jgi:hypothetical protein
MATGAGTDTAAAGSVISPPKGRAGVASGLMLTYRTGHGNSTARDALNDFIRYETCVIRVRSGDITGISR